jgi:hypothetical protein
MSFFLMFYLRLIPVGKATMPRAKTHGVLLQLYELNALFLLLSLLSLLILFELFRMARICWFSDFVRAGL